MAFIIADSPFPGCSAYKILLKITKTITYSKTGNLDWEKEVTYVDENDSQWETEVGVYYKDTPTQVKYRLLKGELCATTVPGEPPIFHACYILEPGDACYDFPDTGLEVTPSSKSKNTIYIRKKTNKISAGTCLAEYKTVGNDRYETCTMANEENCYYSGGYEAVIACVQTDSPSVTKTTSLTTLRQLGSTKTSFSSPAAGNYSRLRIGTLCETNLGWSTAKSPCENSYSCGW